MGGPGRGQTRCRRTAPRGRPVRRPQQQSGAGPRTARSPLAWPWSRVGTAPRVRSHSPSPSVRWKWSCVRCPTPADASTSRRGRTHPSSSSTPSAATSLGIGHGSPARRWRPRHGRRSRGSDAATSPGRPDLAEEPGRSLRVGLDQGGQEPGPLLIGPVGQLAVGDPGRGFGERGRFAPTLTHRRRRPSWISPTCLTVSATVQPGQAATAASGTARPAPVRAAPAASMVAFAVVTSIVRSTRGTIGPPGLWGPGR